MANRQPQTRTQPFSWVWVFISMALFVGSELVLGGLVGGLLVGRFTSIGLRFMLQGVLYLISFFAGGLVIGVISPRVRILEPAVGAALTVALMLTVTIFTPYSFIHFSTSKLLVGGAMALTGARLGERLTGNH
jgi:hypothetical protein